MAGGNAAFAERYGPWALVVGASAGIGAAVADEAARRGINVLTVARRAPLLEEGAARRRATHGVAVQTLAVDLTDPGAVDAIVAATGGLEIGTLVYNAAAEPRGTSSRFRWLSTWTTSPSTARCPPCSAITSAAPWRRGDAAPWRW